MVISQVEFLSRFKSGWLLATEQLYEIVWYILNHLMDSAAPSVCQAELNTWNLMNDSLATGHDDSWAADHDDSLAAGHDAAWKLVMMTCELWTDGYFSNN
jgi:hypothetical protein